MPNDLALAGCFIELFKNQTTHYSPVSQTQHTCTNSRVFPYNLIDPIFLHSLGSYNVWETSSELRWFISYI